MVIRQRFSTLSAKIFTREFNFFLIAHSLLRQNDGVFQLSGAYQNTPNVMLRGERSESH